MTEIRFDDNGLVPGIVQDARNGRVLMVGYLNVESLRLTEESGQVHFWSRSRQEIWHKGATSGNTMTVTRIAADCDGDALLIEVIPAGPACHTGAESCFEGSGFRAEVLAPADLWSTVKSRAW